jgi:2-dehydropantoate 2-reductase
MKVVVVGSGALGGYFGFTFASQGQDVVLVDVDPAKVKEMGEKGLTVTTGEGSRTLKIPITSKIEEAGPADLVFFSVKSYVTLEVAQTLPPLLGPETLVMSIQNGIGNVEKIASVVGDDRVIGGITAHSFEMLSPCHIRYVGGLGIAHIGKIDGINTPPVFEAAGLLRQGGIDIEVHDNIHDYIWYKLLLNTPINAIAAITGLKNGELAENKECRILMGMVADEAFAVARAAGVNILLKEDPVVTFVPALRNAAENKASMLQDVSNRRRTEIEAINGAIVERAENLGMPAPLNRMLTGLVKIIQSRYLT